MTQPFVRGLAVILAAVLVGGCATPNGSAPGKDIPTASDQTEASRRAATRLELASAYFASGQYATALDEVKQTIALQPNNFEAYNLRGLIYAAMGDDGMADESFRQAQNRSPRSREGVHERGWIPVVAE